MSGQRAWRSGAAGKAAEEVISPFIQDYIERRERQRELRAWTAEGSGDHASSWSRTMTWGGRGRPIAEVDVQYQDAAADGQGGFYSVVNFGAVGGLFHQNAAGEERRLFHRERFFCDGIDFQADRRRFVVALGGENGATHLALLDENGKQVQWLTEGDSYDARPAWDPAHPDVVVYQTSGMARRADGGVAFSPWEAAELDMGTGDITHPWSREGMDVLLPRRDRQGRLYALLRPAGGAPAPLWEYAQRIALMPVIFAQGVFGFANAFTSIFARKPLWKAGGPPERVDAAPAVRILGRQLETKVLRDQGKARSSGRTSLAPKSWELWRRDPDGGEHRLASGVSWFTLGADDTPLYSTGLAIHARRDDGEETVYQGPLVESFVAL